MMIKPYIICHMMTSVDGRIDCAMTEQLPGVDEYYKALAILEAPSTLSGRVTAQAEMALPGVFEAKNPAPCGKEGFAKNAAADGYEIVVDTKGTLLWDDNAAYDKPHLIIVSEQAAREYLDYLDARGISWIAAGKEKIDLKRAMEILTEEFGVKRLAVVGGPAVNSSFLAEGLLDEISLLIGAGIDGRGGFPPVFDGFARDRAVTPLRLGGVQTFKDGAVWLRYLV